MIFPDYIQRRYLRGKCLAFAIALKRETGLPVFAAIDTKNGVEEWHHAFVVDEAKQRAYDVRGAMDFTVAEVTAGMASRGICSLRKATIAEIGHRMLVHPTTAEINEARILIRGARARMFLHDYGARSPMTRPKANA